MDMIGAPPRIDGHRPLRGGGRVADIGNFAAFDGRRVRTADPPKWATLVTKQPVINWDFYKAARLGWQPQPLFRLSDAAFRTTPLRTADCTALSKRMTIDSPPDPA